MSVHQEGTPPQVFITYFNGDYSARFDISSILNARKKGKPFGKPFNICDLGRIQTCNLLSRNQVHYSVMLRGRFVGANIISFFKIGYYFTDDFQNLGQKKAPNRWMLFVQFKLLKL